MKEEHDGFKYVKPDAPTESGLYWPEMKDDMWSYCYYLGSWTPDTLTNMRVKQEGKEPRKYDLGVWVPKNAYDRRGVSDATVDCPHNYISGGICIPSYRGYNGGGRDWVEECHYGEVLNRALKYGFKVRAWHDGPLVTQA